MDENWNWQVSVVQRNKSAESGRFQMKDVVTIYLPPPFRCLTVREDRGTLQKGDNRR